MKAQIRKLEITPKEPCYLCGHAIRTEISQGVLDPLYSTVLIIEDLKKRNCFISLDLIIIDLELTNQIKQSIQDATGIEAKHIVVSFTHTHAAPEITEEPIFNEPGKGVRPGYREYVVVQTTKAAILANKELEEVTLHYASTTIAGYYSNRNDKSRPSDKSANILKIQREDASLLGMMVNMSCHSTVLGPQNMYVSGDLFGALRTALAKENNCEVLMIQGASGDMSNRQYRQGNDQEELFRVRDGILPQLTQSLLYTPLNTDIIEYKETSYIMEYQIDLTMLQERMQKQQEQLDKETDFEQIKLLRSGIVGLENVIAAGSDVYLPFNGKIIKIDRLVYVCIPCELFNQLGVKIKETFAKYDIVIWGYCDYSLGYLVTENEYGQSYESIATQITKGMPEKYVSYLIEEMTEFLA